MLNFVAYLFAFLSLILSGAMFGFFYAWVCSTMWGLDAAEPAIAIQAMQAMNASVRNAVFAPAFFGTPIVLLVAAGLAFGLGRKASTAAFALGALVYVLGVFVVTMTVSVPMNQALAAIDVAAVGDRLGAIWQDYSGRWQVWNIVRAVAAGAVLVLAGQGLRSLSRRRRD